MPRHASMKSRPRKSHQRVVPKTQEVLVQPVIEKKLWPRFIVVLALVILIGLGIYGLFGLPTTNTQAALSTAATATATANGILPPFAPTPTPVRTWQTFLTFTGDTTTKNTQTFVVPSDWQITWTCEGIKGVDKLLYISIYNANGTLYSAGEQATCLGAQKVHGNLEEFQSGKVYLKIQSDTVGWTVNVQKVQ